MKTAFLALAFLSLPAFAIKPVNSTLEGSGCPVMFDSDSTGQNLLHPEHGAMQIKFKNQTDKGVIGWQFGLDLMNPVGDFIPFLIPIDGTSSLKPSKGITFNGSLGSIYEKDLGTGFRLYVKKIAFDDGSTWSDDGTQKCQIVHDYRRLKH